MQPFRKVKRLIKKFEEVKKQDIIRLEKKLRR